MANKAPPGPYTPNEYPPPYKGPQGHPDTTVPFDQVFALEQPKWNDLWAGIVVSAPRTLEVSVALLSHRCSSCAVVLASSLFLHCRWQATVS